MGSARRIPGLWIAGRFIVAMLNRIKNEEIVSDSALIKMVMEDPECAGHTSWLAKKS